MAALSPLPVTHIARTEVVAVGDFFAYVGSDGGLYTRIGNLGSFSLLVDLVPSTAIYVPSQSARTINNVVITTSGLILCTYVIGTTGAYGNEYRLVNTSGTIVASGTLQSTTSTFNVAGYAAILRPTYDYSGLIFRFLNVTQVSSMGKTLQSLRSSTLSSTGTYTDVLEIKNVDTSVTTISYSHCLWSRDGLTISILEGANTYTSYNVTTAAGLTAQSTLGAIDSRVYKTGFGSSDSIYMLKTAYTENYEVQLIATDVVSGSWVTYNIGSAVIPNVDAGAIVAHGLRLSSDSSELYFYVAYKHTDTTWHVVVYTCDATASRTASRTLTLAYDTVWIPEVGFLLSSYVYEGGITAKDGSAFDIETNCYYRGTGFPTQTYSFSFTPANVGTTDINAEITLPALSIAATIHAYKQDRDLSVLLTLPALAASAELKLWQKLGSSRKQLSHELTGFEFAGDDISYSVIVNNSKAIPAINFTITKFSELLGYITTQVRISIPINYYSEINESIGLGIEIYMQISSIQRLIASAIVRDISDPNGVERVEIYASSVSAVTASATTIFSEKQFYERNVNNQKAVRIPPNNNISFRDVLFYGENKAQIKAKRVVTFISKNQSFTEVTAV